MLHYYNPQFQLRAPKIEVCKLNKETVWHIKDFYNSKFTVKFSALNVLEFSVPAVVRERHKKVRNYAMDAMKDKFLIRFTWGDHVEYFQITNKTKNMDNTGYHSMQVQCYSLGVQIADTMIREYEEEALTLTAHANHMLARTTWSLDYVDTAFDLVYRSYATSASNALECLFQLAEAFNAAITFDTQRKKISFHEPKNIGKDRGLRPKPGKYLESFNIKIDPQAMKTIVRGFGSEGLEFRSLTPTGSNYLEDYSFFLYPFKCDENYNVITKSAYMSDSFAIALTKYYDKLKKVDGIFADLVEQRTNKIAEIQTAEQQLSVYEAQVADLLNQRDVINKTYADKAPETPQWQDIITRLTAAQNNVASLKITISQLETHLKHIDATIDNFRTDVAVENNFTSAQLLEWKDYQFEADYNNDSIIDEEDLFKETKIALEQYRQPPVSIDMSLEDFTSNYGINLDKDKLQIGDIVEMESKDFGVTVSAKLTQIDYNIDNRSVSLTVANTKMYNSDLDRFIADLGNSANTSTTVDIEKSKWDKGNTAYDEVTKILENAFDAAKQLITGGLNGSVTLSERGLVSVDMLDKNSWLMITNGSFFITPDNGNTVTVAIDKNGVHAERLVGRIILGNKLEIQDDLGIVRIQSGTVTIFDPQGKTRVQLGRYPNPDSQNQYKYGLRVYDGAFDIRTAEGKQGMQIDENGLRTFNTNGVTTFEVVARTGEVKIAGSLSIKTHPDDYRGVVIDGNGLRIYNNSGGIVFNADNFGNVWYAGRLTGATGSVDNLDGTFKGDLVAAGGTFTGTLYGVDGVFTGSLSAVNGTFTGSLVAATGTFEGLVTGSLSTDTMRAISIDADQITSGYIKANRLDVDELSAITANLGYVTSGTIDIDTDLSVGNNIYLGKRYANDIKNVIFSGTTRISGNWSSMDISAMSIQLDGSNIDIGNASSYIRFSGTVDMSGVRKIGF